MEKEIIYFLEETYLSRIHCCIHDIHPAFKCGLKKKSHVRHKHIKQVHPQMISISLTKFQNEMLSMCFTINTLPALQSNMYP